MYMRKSWLAALGIIVILGGGAAYASRGTWRSMLDAATEPTLPTPIAYQPVITPVVTTTVPSISVKTPSVKTPPTSTAPTKPITPPATTSTTPTAKSPFVYVGALPVEVNLAVPFSSQAPKQNWDMPYQEACEETSLIMAMGYLKGRTTDFSPDEADRAILELVEYMTGQGFAIDVTLEEIAKVARDHYGLKSVILELTSIDQVKNALANGYPVILPAAGKELLNPNFRNGGPPYHMLVAKGYLKDGTIITNDPGTRKGKNYLYPAARLFSAIHDWNGGDVKNGRKVALVLLP